MIYYINEWQIIATDKWTVHPNAVEVIEYKQPGEITQYMYKPDWSFDRGELVRLLKERRAEQLGALRDEIEMLEQLNIE